MSLSTTVAEAITKVSELISTVKGQFGIWDRQVRGKIAELEAWKASVGTGINNGDYATQPVTFFTKDTIKDIHIKTDIPKQSNRMCAMKLEGYAYRIVKSINHILSCYNHISGNGIINKDTNMGGAITADFYWSSDGFLCLRLTSTSDFYYTTLRVTPIIVGNSGVYKITKIVNQEGNL